MSVNSVLAGPVAAHSSLAAPDKKAHGAAQQFETLLVAQLLKSTHQSGGGWMGTGGDQAGQTAMDYAEEQFASAMVSGGGLGLASIIEKSLAGSDHRIGQKLQD